MNTHRHLPVLLILTAFTLAGCAPSVQYVRPREWSQPSRVDSMIALFRPALTGHRIFLDPGHGGEDRINRGPAADAIEADVNLRVALALRDYLSQAGAIILMSRTADTSVALQDRPLLAQAARAEVFISLHHNATGTDDAVTNYSSVYYHAREGRPEYHPANHDLARYIQRDLSYAMRNPSPPSSPTFDGTLSDFDIYPNSGFAVLRDNPLPAVLIEASFFTHPPEEQRLARPEFNRIEAWGIFLGIARYFRAGFPSLVLTSDTLFTVSRPAITIGITGAAADPRSAHVMIDGRDTPFTVADPAGTLTLHPERPLVSGRHELSAWVTGTSGNSSWPFRRSLTVMLPPARISTFATPGTLPALPGAMARLVCRGWDNTGTPVADGSRFHVRVPGVFDTAVTSMRGAAVAYVPASAAPGTLSIEVAADPLVELTAIRTVRQPLIYVTGTVSADSGRRPLAAALIRAGGQVRDTTWPDGRYILSISSPGERRFQVTRDGYFSRTEDLADSAGIQHKEIFLTPVADGRLFGKAFLLDPRFGGAEAGDSAGTLRSADINLAIARRLFELLQAAGADVRLLRDGNVTIPEAARAAASARAPRGRYIRIDASGRTMTAGAEIYESIPNRRFASFLLGGIAQEAALDSTGITGSRARFFMDVAMSTTSIVLPSVTTGFFSEETSRRVDLLAWGLFAGILRSEGYTATGPRFTVHDPRGMAVPGVPVALAGTFFRLADRNGMVSFLGLTADPHDCSTEDPSLTISRVP